MSSKQVSSLRRAWYNWKALRLPWRKQFLVGLDLHGNTYWEFKDVRGTDPGRWRRIVKYTEKTHFGDVKVSPQWHQWLRHTRQEPPSLEEQRQDISRQEQLKYLAAQADARWAAKPSLIDGPGQEMGQAVPALETEKPGSSFTPKSRRPLQEDTEGPSETDRSKKQDLTSETREETQGKGRIPEREDPWRRHQGGPSEKWQPKAWIPRTPKS